MTFLPILYIVFYVIILGLGFFIGYRRGIGKAAVRLAYLALVCALSFLISSPISSSVARPITALLEKLIPTDYVWIAEENPVILLLGENIIAAAVNLFVFALIFIALQLLSLICFDKLAEKIIGLVYKKEESPDWSKLSGAFVGLISSVLMASFVLVPLFAAVYVIDTVPEETIAVFTDAYQKNVVEDPNSNATPIENTVSPAIKISKLFPISKLAADAVSRYELPESELCDSVTSVIPKLVELGSDALHVHNETVYAEEDSTVLLNNVAATATLHLYNSNTIRYLSAKVLSIVCTALLEDGDFMGMWLEESDNIVLESLKVVALKHLAETDADGVAEDMRLLFGTVDSSLLPAHKRDGYELNYPNSGYDGVAHKGLLLTVEELQHMPDGGVSTLGGLQSVLNKFSGILYGN